MPVVKANEPLPKRQPIILIYGEPGVGKTSIGNTCDKTLELDFDRGIDRSLFRKDTLQINTWDDIETEKQANTFNNYGTVVIDTPKAALDDYLMNYVVSKDPKLKTNKLGMFGAIGDEFKMFTNYLRSNNCAILMVAHAKKDEDTKKAIPDVTGQSMQLLLRIADQVGYISMKNGKRVITFEPSEYTVGKNVAALKDVIVPDKADPAFRTFGAKLINDVREAIASMSEEQREALEKSAQYQAQIAECEVSELSGLLTVVNELPDYLKLPLNQCIGERYTKELRECKNVALFNNIFSDVNELPEGLKVPLRQVASEVSKAHGWVPNKDTKMFEAPAAAETEPAATGQQGTLIPPAESKTAKRTKKEETAQAVHA